jgi:hypothetical protein
VIGHEEDIVFQNWEKESLDNLKNILSNEIKRCNQEKIFFRGCNFNNYKHNYINRLQTFLKDLDDSIELDFIADEIIYYENSLYDVQNDEASCDGFSKAGIDNFKLLCKILESIGYKQFALSTNKILTFLKEKKIYSNQPINNIYNHPREFKNNPETMKASNDNPIKKKSLNHEIFLETDFDKDDDISLIQKKSALMLFLDKMIDVSILNETPFSELYPWYFLEFTSNLKDEIISNLTFLNESKFNHYLNWVQDKIETTLVYDPDECIIDKWIKEYNLNIDDFPFDFNQEISYLISSFKDNTLNDNEKRKVKLIQLNFHWYAVFLEYNKIVEFISNLKGATNSNFLYPKDINLLNPNHQILKSLETSKKSHNKITTFKWKPKSVDQLSEILWQELIAKNFISSSTKLEVFHNAFNGITIEQPLKIKWTAKGKNAQINKQLLFYLLDTLAINNLIEEDTDNATFIKKISHVFCKEDGNKISHLKVSNSTSSKKFSIKNRLKTPDENKIDVIIETMTSIK